MDKQDKKPRNFRLSLVDAVTHGRLWSIRFSRTAFVVALTSCVVIVVVGIYSIIAFTPIRTFIPGYPDAATRRQAAQNAMRVDSLEHRILQWELYTENMRRIVAGEEPLRIDSLVLGERATQRLDDAVYYALRDSLLRADVRQEEQFEVGSSARKDLPVEALSFFTPVRGVVSRGFDKALHPWLDVSAPAGSLVAAVLDGTVVMTGWDQESGYSLLVQHSGDILSIYQNLEKLLRKSGDAVKAGTPVGVLASSASLTKGDHLHFELWCEGTALDPLPYIKF